MKDLTHICEIEQLENPSKLAAAAHIQHSRQLILDCIFKCGPGPALNGAHPVLIWDYPDCVQSQELLRCPHLSSRLSLQLLV